MAIKNTKLLAMSLNDFIFFPSMEDLLSQRIWYIMNRRYCMNKKEKDGEPIHLA